MGIPLQPLKPVVKDLSQTKPHPHLAILAVLGVVVCSQHLTRLLLDFAPFYVCVSRFDENHDTMEREILSLTAPWLRK